MCGIAGAFGSEDVETLRSLVDPIVKHQYKRGPDYQAVEAVAGPGWNAVLGHDRLGIIDLSPEANQPMWDHSRRFGLVYNGELYNYLELRRELIDLGHKFSTQSDSEVLIEAFKEWGVGAPSRFNGMFAFALFDRAEGRLFLVRDRFGVKPLFYGSTARGLAFASSASAIARTLGLKPSLPYAAKGLQFGFYDEGSDAPFEGLTAVAPGHYMEASMVDGRLRTALSGYYNLQERVATLTDALLVETDDSLTSRMLAYLENAVVGRLRADVPVGISLSGGLDSSTTASLVKSHSESVVGFTFGDPHNPRTEGPLVSKLSSDLGLRVRYIHPTVDAIARSYLKTLDEQEAPFLSGSIMAQNLLYEAVRDAGVKVLLGGQGGDEAFMGYRKFLVFRLIELMRSRDYVQALQYAMALVPTVAFELPRASVYWHNRRRYTSQDGRASALHLPPVAPRQLRMDRGLSLRDRQILDVTNLSLPTLLRYEDRNSMGNSVESRLPFLDYRLMEFGLALPTVLKVRRGYGKWIVRNAFRGKIPNAIRMARYKRGFDVLQSNWIVNGLGQEIRNALHERQSDIRQFAGDLVIDRMFSDDQLVARPLAFAEATTLIWLARESL